MRMSLVALVMVGSAAIASAQASEGTRSLEDAIKLHQTGKIDPSENKWAADRVKEDIKACLTFYEPNECTGPAADWVKRWDALKLQPSTGATSSSPQPVDLLRPSLLQLHVPFTKSAADYFVTMPSPSASGTR